MVFLRTDGGRNMGLFNNERYISLGIKSQVPMNLSETLWFMLDKLKNRSKELEYVQMFKLSACHEDGKTFQIIEHIWEENTDSSFIRIESKETFTGTILIVDDGFATVMCFPSER